MARPVVSGGAGRAGVGGRESGGRGSRIGSFVETIAWVFYSSHALGPRQERREPRRPPCSHPR